MTKDAEGPRTLKLEVAMNRRHVAVDKECGLLVLLKLGAAERAPGDRLPLNLSFVLDRSGSMAGQKLAYTKRAVEFALHHLTSRDTASVVSFDDEVEIPVPQRKVTDKGAVAAAVYGLTTGGSTNLSGGLLAGYRNVKRFAAHGQVNRVLLLTDGLANVGITDPGELAERARSMRESGLTLSTLGVGTDFDEELLTALARAGGGETYFIENPDRIPEIFAQELQGLLSVVAQNVVMAFSPAAECSIRRIMGYAFHGGPDGVVAPVPDMYAGEERGLLLEVSVRPLRTGKHTLGEITIEFDEAGGSGGSVKLKNRLEVTATQDEGALRTERDHPDVLRAWEIHGAAEAMEEAVRLADEGRVEEALFCLDAESQVINQLPSVVMAPELERVRDEIQAQAQRLRQSGYDNASRKQMVFSSCELRQVRRRAERKP